MGISVQAMMAGIIELVARGLMSLAEKILDDRRLQIRFTPPLLLSELLKESGVFFDMPCGGRHICKKCRINVSGDVSPATEFELSSLSHK